jgi:hypothetical protein
MSEKNARNLIAFRLALVEFCHISFGREEAEAKGKAEAEAKRRAAEEVEKIAAENAR